MVIDLKRLRISLIVLAILFSLFAAAAVFQHFSDQNTAKMVSLPFAEQQISEKPLVYLFIGRIQEQSEQFYEPYYVMTPAVAYYFTTVKEIREDGANICITFMSFPYLGPHDTIGEDEVTFCVNHSGEIIDMEFKHLKSYNLPDNLSHLERGALPPVSK